MADIEHVSVVIIGGGPVGTLLSALLSRNYNISNVVLEKESAIPEDPRAFSLGEFGTRILQNVGLLEKFKTDISLSQPYLRFVGGKHTDLDHPPFLKMCIGCVGCTGLEKGTKFYQPEMERILRDVIADSSYGSFRVGCEVVHIEDNDEDDCVYVTYEEKVSSSRRVIKADHVVGCDGRRGFTRKKYLEPRGVILERPNPYTQLFFGMNLDITAPTPESHPRFPLWKQGYSPMQVLDLFIPKDLIFLCNPDRQGVVSRVSPVRQTSVRARMELSVRSDEDPDQMARPETCLEHLKPYLEHSGRKYGLSQEVQFPLDCVEIRRTWQYKFEVRLCNKWRVGRVMIAGDAAHIFPPFGGQGVQAGFLDVNGLAWRLAAISEEKESVLHNNERRNRPIASQRDALLDSWVAERKTDISRVLGFAMAQGAKLLETDPWKIFLRDWKLWLLQLLPSWREQMSRVPLGIPRYSGPSDGPEAAGYVQERQGGLYWWQIYCRQVEFDESTAGSNQMLKLSSKISLTDDIIFAQGKRGLFQLVVLLNTMSEVFNTREDLRILEHSWNNSNTALFVSNLCNEATYVVHEMSLLSGNKTDVFEQEYDGLRNRSDLQSRSCIVIPATLSELLSSSHNFFKTSEVTDMDEFGSEYDPMRFQKQHPGMKYIILRPDSFVFSASINIGQFGESLARLERLMKR